MELAALLSGAIDARKPLFDEAHTSAFRLFNGFLEGLPALVLDVYGKTLVVHDHAEAEVGERALVTDAVERCRAALPWLTTALWKVRNAKDEGSRAGSMLFGDEKQLARRVLEHGVTYALDLRVNRDASFYLDTRALRAWAKTTLTGKTVLNTFAYTGSLGVAALAGGAKRVMHTDVNKRFLTVAKDSYSMNGWPVAKRDFRVGDFFDVAGQLKRDDQRFDCVFVDPPFFSVTPKGRVDVVADPLRLLNKVRPLVAHDGWLVVVNNGVFVSGADFSSVLESLCADGYVTLEARIDVPDDVVGYPATRRGKPMVDPAPFRHSTKMAVLKVKRKDTKGATA